MNRSAVVRVGRDVKRTCINRRRNLCCIYVSEIFGKFPVYTQRLIAFRRCHQRFPALSFFQIFLGVSKLCVQHRFGSNLSLLKIRLSSSVSICFDFLLECKCVSVITVGCAHLICYSRHISLQSITSSLTAVFYDSVHLLDSRLLDRSRVVGISRESPAT